MNLQQTAKFKPKMVSIRDGSKIEELKELLKAKGVTDMPELLAGAEGITEVARHKDCEAVVTGIVGCAGLAPTVAAIEAGKDICLANKETLIAGAASLRSHPRAHPGAYARALSST